jgi:hypothetical protein
MGDVEDPDLYVAAPIYEWQQTTAGKTAMKYAKDPKYYIHSDVYSMGYKVTVTGRLEGKYATLYELKKA